MTQESPTRRLGELRRRVRRRLALHRRPLAALLVAAATLLVLRDLQAPPPPAVWVWTAAHDLPPGQTLAADDLSRVAFAPGTVPDGVVRVPGQVLGRTVAAGVRRGEAVTDTTVLHPAPWAAEPGRVAVPVRLADPGVAALLRVGDAVDLVAVSPDGVRAPEVVATDARVAALPALPTTDPVAGGTGLAGRLVVLDVEPEVAAKVAASGVSAYLTVTFGH